MADADELLAAVKADDAARVRAVLGRNPFLRRMRTPEGTLVLTAKHQDAVSALAAILEHVNEDELNLYEASALGRAGRLKTILGQSRRRVNEPDAQGFTPLGLAAYFGQPDAVKVLLDHGAVMAAGREGADTPLGMARARGHEDVVGILEARGAPGPSDSRKPL
ncbi:MAG TPA: ankyrin repeat domain-containing protein [Thermoplasmata archaeon]|nr:ankyrin repeat domain-containing protein [Thermoplasmata archaeon]